MSDKHSFHRNTFYPEAKGSFALLSPNNIEVLGKSNTKRQNGKWNVLIGSFD